MNVKDAVKKRYSVRDYLDKTVPVQDLAQILDAGRLAPSAKNTQEWRFVVVRDSLTRQRICLEAAKGREFVAKAPVIIACCAQTDYAVMTCGQLYYPINVAIAIDHMTLVATEMGIGSCWIGAFYEDKIKEILLIPDNIRVVELLLLGYPADSHPGQKNRLAIEDIVKYENW